MLIFSAKMATVADMSLAEPDPLRSPPRYDGLSLFGLLHHFGRLHSNVHSPRMATFLQSAPSQHLCPWSFLDYAKNRTLGDSGRQ